MEIWVSGGILARGLPFLHEIRIEIAKIKNKKAFGKKTVLMVLVELVLKVKVYELLGIIKKQEAWLRPPAYKYY
jgi:hypothetical protein